MRHTCSTFILIMALMWAGGFIIAFSSNWMVLLGIFLWTWGNNIDIHGKF